MAKFQMWNEEKNNLLKILPLSKPNLVLEIHAQKLKKEKMFWVWSCYCQEKLKNRVGCAVKMKRF